MRMTPSLFILALCMLQVLCNTTQPTNFAYFRLTVSKLRDILVCTFHNTNIPGWKLFQWKITNLLVIAIAVQVTLMISASFTPYNRRPSHLITHKQLNIIQSSFCHWPNVSRISFHQHPIYRCWHNPTHTSVPQSLKFVTSICLVFP